MDAESRKPRLLTLKQAAALVEGLTAYRVRQLCINGDIKFHKFGNKYMISESEIYKYFGIND
jgi:excisionase family DNA binding protein